MVTNFMYSFIINNMCFFFYSPFIFIIDFLYFLNVSDILNMVFCQTLTQLCEIHMV